MPVRPVFRDIMERLATYRYGKGILFAFLISIMPSAEPLAGELKPGDPFPSLILPSVADGQPNSMLAYRGRKTVLHVFASW